ncbi:Transmembrane protein 8A, partial [Fasciola gigantica]
CTPDEEVTGTDRDEHYSAIPVPVQQLDAKNNSESNATDDNSVHWNVSLLPWLNSSWPELTPESGRRRPMRRNMADYPLLNETNLAVDPRNPAHQLLQRCTLWSAPSRVSMPQAFASHFTYQPLLRQVILHGCFARHITSTPFGFIDSTRCPLWLRLATDRGLAVSVAHAVSIAASNVLSRSQPPHRSEVLPALDTSFDDVVDRSFFYLPYPTPGQWYLSLYAECYPVDDPLCSQAAAASIDVGLVMRLTPCLNYRCRDVGEGASLPPSRVLNASRVGIRPLIERPQPITQGERWRPPWLIRGFNASNPRQSPLLLPPSSDMPDDRPLAGEGLCVELLQRSIFASTCACPPGRAGLGCMRFLPNAFSQSNRSTFLGAQDDALDYMWSGHSPNALLLALSNLAFLPAVGLALLRRLWIPALAYSYTLVFSALYHICDTDVMNIPIRIGASTIGGSAMSFGGYALPKSRGYDLLGSEPSGYRPIPTGFRFTSPSCPLPLDVLSFCDFFGGVLSVWVTVVAATACPLRYAQLAYVMFVLSLTVAVQVARYSTGLFLIPCLIGLIVLICSWTYRSKRTGRLFPPVQWWLISFFPGLLLAGIGLILFLSPWMRRDYAKVHSLWHIVIGLSLLGLLPWPRRWRIALVKVVPLQTPLSCGGDHFGSRRPNRTRRVGSARSCRSTSPSSESLTGPGPEVPVTTATRNSTGFPMLRRATQYIHAHFCQMGCRAHQILTVWCDRLDVWLELDRLLDPIVARWPRLDWLLPNGYIPGRSRALSSRSNSMLPTSMPNGPSTHSTDAVSETRAALQAKQI